MRRSLLIVIIFLSLAFPVYGQGPPSDVMQDAASQQDQLDQEQAAHSLEKEKAAPNKIGNISESSLLENFKKGGTIMYFILACSIIGIYVTIERMFSLQRRRILPRKFINNILSIVSNAPRLESTAQPPPYPSVDSPSMGYGYSPPPQASHSPFCNARFRPSGANYQYIH